MISDAPAGLVTLLNTARSMVTADLYTITLSGGAVLRYTSFDRPVTIGGVTWGVGPVISRGKVRVTVGVEVDSLSMSISADSSVLVNGKPLMQIIVGGGLDGARVLVERAYKADALAAPAGKLFRFSGNVTEQGKIVTGSVSFTVKSDLEYLSEMVPRNVYQPPCDNTLYDSTCGVQRASFTASGAATSASDSRKSYFSHNLSQASWFFNQGVVTFTSGANAGISRTVKIHNGASGGNALFPAKTIVTVSPWPAPVASGDAFTIYAGCDKSRATCIAKFANLSRFRGAPFIPVAQTVT